MMVMIIYSNLCVFVCMCEWVGVQHVEAASVTLFVIDRLHLSPAGETYLLQGSTIRYSLWKTEQEGETGTNQIWFMLFLVPVNHHSHVVH